MSRRDLGKVLLSAGLLAILGTHGRAEDPAPPPAARIETVAPGVFAALQPEARRFDDANVVIVLGTEAALVIDAPSDPAVVDLVVEKVRETKIPALYLVNTHWHSDHTQGNQRYRAAFGEGLEIVGHVSLIEETPRAAADLRERVENLEETLPKAVKQLAAGLSLSGRELSESERQQQAQSIERAREWVEANRGVEFLPPTRTYQDELVLDLGGVRVRLLHFRGHTRGDTVAWVPERGVLITGDLLDELPFVGHGFPKTWIDALDRLAELPFQAVIPGHGRVYRGSKQLERVRGYLQDLVDRVGAAAAAGHELEETRSRIDMSDWRARLAGEDEVAGRFFDGVLGEAIERVWNQSDRATAATTESPLSIVEGLVAAFNAHDVDAMLEWVSDEVEWLAIDGKSIGVEASGKSALREGMTGYFSSLPTVHSTVEKKMASGKYVIVRERAHWTHDGEDQSRSALAVYEVSEGKVRRVWYFPAET